MFSRDKKKSFLEFEIPLAKISIMARALFARHLAMMLKSGISISEALMIVQDSAAGRLKKIVGEVAKTVRAGSSLADAFSRYPKVFSGLFGGAVYAGEASGTLSENLENIAEQLEKEQALNSKIKRALFYPLTVLGMAFVLGMGLAFFVLPKIMPLFEGLKVDLPFTTKALIWFSHLVQKSGFYIFSGIIVFLALFVWLLKRKFIRPLTHRFLLRCPIVKKISRNINLARLARTLGMLLKSGVNIDQALEITEKTLSNYYYKRALGKVSQMISQGNKLSDGLARFEKLFPPIFVRMLKVGEESGRFEETLFYLARFYESQVDGATKSLALAIEPILLLVIGLVVGFLALSIMTPIYNISGGIRR